MKILVNKSQNPLLTNNYSSEKIDNNLSRKGKKLNLSANVRTRDQTSKKIDHIPFWKTKEFYLAISILSVGIIPASRYILHRVIVCGILPAVFDRNLTITQPHDGIELESVDLETADKEPLRLKSTIVSFKDSEKKDPQDQKWIIFFNGNGMSYELATNTYSYITYKRSLVENTPYKLLMFNYRGVNRNLGFPWSFHDTVTDGNAAVEYLLKQGFKRENIELWGFSKGGAVATYVARNYPGVKLVNISSYSKLSKVAADVLLTKSIKKIAPIRYVLEKISANVEPILEHINWNPNPASVWPEIKGKKLIVTNPYDNLIKAEVGMAKGVIDANPKKEHPIFTLPIEFGHVLPYTDKQILRICQAASKAFREKIPIQAPHKFYKRFLKQQFAQTDNAA